MKTCKKCGGSLFYASGKCKSCVKAYSAARYALNPEKANESSAKWRLENSERLKEYDKAWKSSNPDKVNAQRARYRESHRELNIARTEAWSKANPGKAKARSAEWHKNNPERAKALMDKFFAKNPGAMASYRQNRRARKNSSNGKISAGMAQKLFKLQKGKCPCCKQELGDNFHLDHVIPLALGGSNTDDNMQLLRAKCNQQKHAKHPVDFMQERGYLL